MLPNDQAKRKSSIPLAYAGIKKMDHSTKETGPLCSFTLLITLQNKDVKLQSNPFAQLPKHGYTVKLPFSNKTIYKLIRRSIASCSPQSLSPFKAFMRATISDLISSFNWLRYTPIACSLFIVLLAMLLR